MKGQLFDDRPLAEAGSSENQHRLPVVQTARKKTTSPSSRVKIESKDSTILDVAGMLHLQQYLKKTIPKKRERSARGSDVPVSTETPYSAPRHLATAFNCPSHGCGIFAKQVWSPLICFYPSAQQRVTLYPEWDVAICTRCKQPSIWANKCLVSPIGTTAFAANKDLPPGIAMDVEEAMHITAYSPRGAAAILRLAIQKLCRHLGETGIDLNADISALIKKGLLPSSKHSFDTARVIGNNAVRPGQVDLHDEMETVSALFGLVNLIATQMITARRGAAAIYGLSPAEGA